MDGFSKRQGYSQKEKEIVTREDAPPGLREFIPQLVYDLGYEPSYLRGIICRVLKVRPDANNWTDYPNISGEVEQLIDGCDWFKVYDVIEVLWSKIGQAKREKYESEINDFFRQNGIGWKLEDGIVETRGDEVFEGALDEVTELFTVADLPTARAEIREAIRDLSRRPDPDITGAIQHAGAALECVVREVVGDPKATLGEIIKKYPDIIPKPLNVAIEKIWGFTSEQGRHLKEGKTPELPEAELVVELSAAISSYLVKKKTGIDMRTPKQQMKDY